MKPARAFGAVVSEGLVGGVAGPVALERAVHTDFEVVHEGVVAALQPGSDYGCQHRE